MAVARSTAKSTSRDRTPQTRGAQVLERRAIVTVERDRALERGERIRVAAGGCVRDAEVVLHLRRLGYEHGGALQLGHRERGVPAVERARAGLEVTMAFDGGAA